MYNYTIKSTAATVFLGPNTISSTPMVLVDLVMNQSLYEPLFNYSINGNIQVLLDGVLLENPTPVISGFIQWFINENTNNLPLLRDDFITKGL